MAIALNNKNRFDWIQALLFGLALAFVLFLASCSCDYHLSKAKSKCGLANLTDTIHDTITVYIPEIRGKDSAKVNADFSFFENKIDSLLLANFQLDSIAKHTFKKTTLKAYKERKCLTDTFTIIPKKGAYIKFWQESGQFKCDYYFPQDTIKKEVPVIVNKTELKGNIWSELFSWKNLFILFLLLLALYLIKTNK